MKRRAVMISAKRPLVGLGINGSYANLAADYLFKATGSPLSPSFMLDTLGNYSKPQQTTSLTCVPPRVLSGTSCVVVVSDRRLKRAIRLLATLGNGIKIYAFKYLWSDKVYVGVMAQDLGFTRTSSGKKPSSCKAMCFYAVDYALLGLRMTTLDDWESRGSASIRAVESLSLLD